MKVEKKEAEFGITIEHCSNVERLIDVVEQLANQEVNMSIATSGLHGWDIAYSSGPTTTKA